MNAAEIGVTAKAGVVTLSGIVDSYSKKINAENVVKKVKGVKILVEDIEIHYGHSYKKNDSEIAKDILKAWEINWEVPGDRIQAKVEDGWITLTGEVAWKYQEEAGKNAIKNLLGVKGMTNFIKVRSNSKDAVEQKAVENALSRDWSINSNNVKVEVVRNTVKLTGLVHSLYQKDEAGRLAWNAPGVRSVDNELSVIF